MLNRYQNCDFRHTSQYVPETEMSKWDINEKHAAYADFIIREISHQIECDVENYADSTPGVTLTSHYRTNPQADGTWSIPDVFYVDYDSKLIIVGEAKGAANEVSNKHTEKQITSYMRLLAESQYEDYEKQLIFSVPYIVEPDAHKLLNRISEGIEFTGKSPVFRVISEDDNAILPVKESVLAAQQNTSYTDCDISSLGAISYTCGYFPQSELLFDEENYRIIGTEGTLTQDQCYAALLAEQDVIGNTREKDARNRRRDLISEGCITEPLLGYRNDNGGIVIIDGNSRLAHARHFCERAQQAPGYELLQVKVYETPDRNVLNALKAKKQHHQILQHDMTADAITVYRMVNENLARGGDPGYDAISDHFGGYFTPKITKHSYETIKKMKEELRLGDDTIREIYRYVYTFIANDVNPSSKSLLGQANAQLKGKQKAVNSNNIIKAIVLLHSSGATLKGIAAFQKFFQKWTIDRRRLVKGQEQVLIRALNAPTAFSSDEYDTEMAELIEKSKEDKDECEKIFDNINKIKQLVEDTAAAVRRNGSDQGVYEAGGFDLRKVRELAEKSDDLVFDLEALARRFSNFERRANEFMGMGE